MDGVRPELEAAKALAKKYAETARDLLGHDVNPPEARQLLQSRLDPYRQRLELRVDLIIAVLTALLALEDAIRALEADGYPDLPALVLPQRESDAAHAEETDLHALLAQVRVEDSAEKLTGTFGTPRKKS